MRRRWYGRGPGVAAVLAGIAVVSGCSTPERTPAPSGSAPNAATVPLPPRAAAPAPSSSAAAATLERPRARWVAAEWSELPGFALDRVAEFVPALLRSCEKPAAGWAAVCLDAFRDSLALVADESLARAFLQARLRPYRVEALPREAAADAALGLATGYFEPLVAASRTSRPGFRVPLYAPPADLAARTPWWTRREMEREPAARRALRGREIAWLADPLDALVLQVQGSGRVAFDGAPPVRLAYAGHNGQPYQSVGRWLVGQGELTLEQASWPAIRAWAARHPGRVEEMLAANPRVVFFREEPLPDAALGPRGAQGVPLTPQRSIAVDPGSIPYGTPVWLDSTEPLSSEPLRRLVVAQDTGSAIVGAVRADYFWGWGAAAEAAAGRMKQPLRLWVLWPR